MQKTLLLLLFVGGFSFKNANAQSGGLLDANAFETTLKNDKTAQLVDVRTPEEFNSGHIEGALNYDFYQPDFEQNLSKLDKKRTVMVYCAAGGRSGTTAERLQKLGFGKVYDLDGGMGAWKKAGKKTVK